MHPEDNYLRQLSQSLKDNDRKKGKKPRVLTKTCSGQVFNRILKELKLDLYTINAATGLPVTTLFDWKNGAVPTNPEQLEKLLKYLQKFDAKFTYDYFYFGIDEDREALRIKIEEEAKKTNQLERENFNLKTQLSFLEAAQASSSDHTENEGEESLSKLT